MALAQKKHKIARLVEDFFLVFIVLMPVRNNETDLHDHQHSIIHIHRLFPMSWFRCYKGEFGQLFFF